MALPDLTLYHNGPRPQSAHPGLPEGGRDRWRLLAELSGLLGDSDDVDEAIAGAMTVVVPQFADDCAFHVGAPPASSDLPVVIGADDALLCSFARDDDHLRELRDSPPTSVIAAPMRRRGQHVGMAYFATTHASMRRYRLRDVSLASDIALRLATAIYRLQIDAQLRTAVAEARRIVLSLNR